MKKFILIFMGALCVTFLLYWIYASKPAKPQNLYLDGTWRDERGGYFTFDLTNMSYTEQDEQWTAKLKIIDLNNKEPDFVTMTLKGIETERTYETSDDEAPTTLRTEDKEKKYIVIIKKISSSIIILTYEDNEKSDIELEQGDILLKKDYYGNLMHYWHDDEKLKAEDRGIAEGKKQCGVHKDKVDFDNCVKEYVMKAVWPKQ